MILLGALLAIVAFHVRVLWPCPGVSTFKACRCGAHWWIRRGPFWRHLDASPFNDKLQDQWTFWMYEFNTALKLTPVQKARMGYPRGPLWEDGTPMWTRSKWQLSLRPESYCLRCTLHGLSSDS